MEQYARHHQLEWVEDDSNQDERFDRNFLRHRVLPLLTRRWPHFPAAAARSARLCAEQEQLLDELLAESLRELRRPDGALSIEGLLPLSPLRRFAPSRRWLAGENAPMPSREQLQRLWDEVAVSRQDAEPVLQLGRRQIRRFRQHLYLLPLLPTVKGRVVPWSSFTTPLTLPEGWGDSLWRIRVRRCGRRRTANGSASGLAPPAWCMRRGGDTAGQSRSCGRSWRCRRGGAIARRCCFTTSN